MRRRRVPRIEQHASGSVIEKFELAETLNPGGQAEAYPLLWDQGNDPWFLVVPGITQTIHDLFDRDASDVRYGPNFGLTGEVFDAWRNPSTGRYEIIGSRGLLRRAKSDGAISNGASGLVSIWHRPGASDADSGENVTAVNDWGGTADISGGDEVWISYQWDTRQWKIIPSGGGSAFSHVYGSLSAPTGTYNLFTPQTINFTNGISGGMTADTTNDYIQVPAEDDYYIGFSASLTIDTAGDFEFRIKATAATILGWVSEHYPTADDPAAISASGIVHLSNAAQLQLELNQTIGGTATLDFGTLFAIRMN